MDIHSKYGGSERKRDEEEGQVRQLGYRFCLRNGFLALNDAHCRHECLECRSSPLCETSHLSCQPVKIILYRWPKDALGSPDRLWVYGISIFSQMITPLFEEESLSNICNGADVVRETPLPLGQKGLANAVMSRVGCGHLTCARQ